MPRALILDHELGALLGMSLPSGSSASVTATVAAGSAPPVARLIRPVFDRGFLDRQLPLLRAYGDLRLDRMAEIQLQTTDFLSFFGSLVYLDREARKRTLELLHAILRLAGRIEMRLKMHFDFPRPITVCTDLQPVIQTPGHGSWPSGHATEAFAVAVVLTALMRGGAVDTEAEIAAGEHPMRLAQRIATNRTIAGMHYPSDSMAGAVLGIAIGELVVNHLEATGVTPARSFDGAAFTAADTPGPWDFDLGALGSVLAGSGKVNLAGTASQLLTSLWSFAKDEW
jgi:membrane-associated phospholipid phosphatase